MIKFSSSDLLYAHRIAWSLAHGGRDPGRKDVLHSCDNRACCNPKHLRLGNQERNMLDAIKRRRYWVKVRAIRASFESYTSLARRYAVSKSLIARVKTGKLWKHAS